MRAVTAGFTLVEVLVALLVVALGAAGAVAVHVRALRTVREAACLSDAVQLANALAARMLANPGAASVYLAFDSAGGGPLPDASCFVAACDPEALARFDLAETAADVVSRLPGGRVLVCRDAGAPDPDTGLPAWACDGAADGPAVVKVGWRVAGAADAPSVVLPVGALP